MFFQWYSINATVVDSNHPPSTPFFPPIFQKELKRCYSLRERNVDLEAK
jgi:hypothetical protein